MRTCQKCKSLRVAAVSGKTSDMAFVEISRKITSNGYVPDDLGIGGGDYLKFSVCLDCGQMQGTWPRPKTDMENGE